MFDHKYQQRISTNPSMGKLGFHVKIQFDCYKSMLIGALSSVVVNHSMTRVALCGNVRSFSSSTRSRGASHLNDCKKLASKAKKKVVLKGETPSSGFIGSTNFSMLVPIFESKLPYLKDKGISITTLIEKTISAHDDLIRSQGIIHGTNRWKAITHYANGVLEGREPDNPGWVAVGKTNKFPKLFGHLLPVAIYILDHSSSKKHQETVAESRRFLHTLFKLNRVCHSNRELIPLLENIGKKHPIDPNTLAGFEQYVRKELGAIRERITLTDFDIPFFLGASNGPNSRPKTHSALEEAAALVHIEKFSNLFKAVEKFCIATGNKHFLDFLMQCSKKYSNLPSWLTNIQLRKLTAIPDSGNKSRVIAICDFWTQCVLAPLESNVLSITRELFQEKIAFDSHAEGWAKIMAQPREIQSTLVSLDATSWTDNFPAILQYITVKAAYGQTIADAWKALAVDCDWYVPGMPRTINFGKGQGMGTKGSFAIAQLTDLLFIGYVLGKDTYFIKVGDDLVVQDPGHKLAEAYRKIGLPINLAKSKFSTSQGDFIEFVSRNLWNGIDYSIISPTLISKFLRDDYYCLTLLKHIQERQTEKLTLSQLMGYKLEVLKSRANFDLERFESRLQNLMLSIKLMQIAGLDSSIEVDLSKLPRYSSAETLRLYRNLVLVTLGELSHKQALLAEGVTATEEASVSLLAGLLKESNKRYLNPILSKKNGEIFFEGVIREEFTFEEAILVWKARAFLNRINERQNVGSQHYVDFQVPDPLIDFEGKTSLNPEFIKCIINLWISLIDSHLNHMVVRKNPFEARGNREPVALELFKLLNRVLVQDESILNMTTGEYRLSADKKKSVQVKPELIQGFLSLFKLDHILTKLDSNRSFPVLAELFTQPLTNDQVGPSAPLQGQPGPKEPS